MKTNHSAEHTAHRILDALGVEAKTVSPAQWAIVVGEVKRTYQEGADAVIDLARAYADQVGQPAAVTLALMAVVTQARADYGTPRTETT